MYAIGSEKLNEWSKYRIANSNQDTIYLSCIGCEYFRAKDRLFYLNKKS